MLPAGIGELESDFRSQPVHLEARHCSLRKTFWHNQSVILTDGKNLQGHQDATLGIAPRRRQTLGFRHKANVLCQLTLQKKFRIATAYKNDSV
jgi:hypothetical protein